MMISMMIFLVSIPSFAETKETAHKVDSELTKGAHKIRAMFFDPKTKPIKKTKGDKSLASKANNAWDSTLNGAHEVLKEKK